MTLYDASSKFSFRVAAAEEGVLLELVDCDAHNIRASRIFIETVHIELQVADSDGITCQPYLPSDCNEPEALALRLKGDFVAEPAKSHVLSRRLPDWVKS